MSGVKKKNLVWEVNKNKMDILRKKNVTERVHEDNDNDKRYISLTEYKIQEHYIHI